MTGASGGIGRAVVGELLAGVVLGPTIFGRIAPDAYDLVFGDDVVQAVVFGLAWIGVILLLVVIVLSAVISHAPSKLRYYSLYHRKVIRSILDTKG